jgi:hypothetical protein
MHRIEAERREPSDMKMQNKAKSVQSAKFYALGTMVPVFVQNKPNSPRFQSKIEDRTSSMRKTNPFSAFSM